LLWDFTNTHPGDSMHNQKYYIRDLPSKQKGKVKIDLSHVPAGKYSIKIYKVGYRVNDAYTSYLDMGKPLQLNRQQVNKIKNQNNGAPVTTEKIEIKSDGIFSKELTIRENDVFLVSLVKL